MSCQYSYQPAHGPRGVEDWNTANMDTTLLPYLDENGYDPWGDPHEELAKCFRNYPGGQPLVRDPSSGGNSYLSASSPGDYYTVSPADTMNPVNMYTSPPLGYGGYDVHHAGSLSQEPSPSGEPPYSVSGGGKRFHCDYCDREFNRQADKARHIRHVHVPSSLSHWQCDYTKCGRKTDPFTRPDHYRNHLRDQHNEDLPPRGQSLGMDWYESRNWSRHWWRCAKCLIKVSVKKTGFQCPGCDGAAGSKRQELRS